MKKLLLNLSMLCSMLLVLTLTSCKKDTNNTDDSVAAKDASNISSIMNASSDDAENSLSTNQTLSGKTQGVGFEVICNANVSVDSIGINAGTATINYTGDDCSGKISRSGTITVTLVGYSSGVRWRDTGAVLSITYNLTATVIGTSETYTITGTHYITNVNGGLAYMVMDGLAPNTTVVRHHTCNNAMITFPDGSMRTWGFNRLRTYTNPGGTNPTISYTGDTTVNGISNTAQWGTDRVGDAFYAATPAPITSDFACGFFHPTAGQYIHHVANRTADVIFGVDLSGNAYTGTGCAYGYKITYTKGAKTVTATLPYL